MIVALTIGVPVLAVAFGVALKYAVVRVEELVALGLVTTAKWLLALRKSA